MANTPTTDLVTVSSADATNAGGTWADNTFSQFDNGNAANFGVDDLLYIHNDLAISQQLATNRTGASSSIGFTATTAQTPLPNSNNVFWFWWNFLYPGAMQEYNDNSGVTVPGQNNTGGAAGYFICIGTDSTNYKAFHVGGANFGRNPQGGWQSVVCDPLLTTFPGFSGGTPGTSNFDTFGFVPNINTAPGRGQANAVDVIRFGRGSINYTGGAPAGTFSAMAAQNDSNTNRWGIFQAISGGYLFKGRLGLGGASLGQDLLFTDSNANITIDETRAVASGFNQVEIDNSSSNITWTNVNFVKVASAGLSIDDARGVFNINNGTVSMTNCSFTETGSFTVEDAADVSLTGCTFRNTSVITPRINTTFDDCVFDSCRVDNTICVSSLNTDFKTEIENITNCRFTSDGSNHAINIGPNTGPTAISPSSDVAISLDNIKFTNYSTASPLDTNITGTAADANAAISLIHNGTGTIFFDVLNGGDIPSIENTGSGNVQIRQSFSINVTGILGNSEVRVYDNPSRFSGGSTAVESTNPAGYETVNATTKTGDGSTSEIWIDTSQTNIRIQLPNATGAQLDTLSLVEDDIVRLTVRDNAANPNLELFDEFTVDTVSSGIGTTITTKDLSSGFTSAFATVAPSILLSNNALTVTLEKVNATASFTASSGTYDIFVYRIGSLPIVTKGQVLNAANPILSVPISQVRDRVYNNPA